MDHEKAVGGALGVIGAVAKEAPVLGTAVKLGLAVRDGLLEDGSKRLETYVQEEIRDTVFRRFPEIEQRVRALEEAGVDAKVSDFVHVTRCFGRTWTTAADPKKRRLLEDAFVRSFDPELYGSGLLNALWARVERLSYGDLRLLRDMVEWSRTGEKGRSMFELTEQLSLAVFHAENLQREALLWVQGPIHEASHILPTDLAVRLYWLAWGQLPEPGQAVDEHAEGSEQP